MESQDYSCYELDLAREGGRLATERGVTLEVVRAQGSVLADPTRLRQVLLNLLSSFQ